MSRFRSRLIIATTAAIVVALLGSAPALAHVTVNPGEAEQGGFAKLTFRMPTERDNASSTKLEVTFPEDQPLAFVNVKPHLGWTYQVTKTKLDEPITDFGDPIDEVVTKITWTAEGKKYAIKPGQFDEFDVSVGRLPEDADQMVFKAVQTYDSGEVVKWIELAAPGAKEGPEHPAPILKLVPPQEEGAASGVASDTGSHTEEDDSTTAVWALVLSIAALALGAAGLGLGWLARRRTTAG